MNDTICEFPHGSQIANCFKKLGQTSHEMPTF